MALLRYITCMATIQIRDLSEHTYEVIRRRARAAGMSIQAYMKTEIERLAEEPSENELFALVEQHLTDGGIRLDRETFRKDLEADRR